MGAEFLDGIDWMNRIFGEIRASSPFSAPRCADTQTIFVMFVTTFELNGCCDFQNIQNDVDELAAHDGAKPRFSSAQVRSAPGRRSVAGAAQRR